MKMLTYAFHFVKRWSLEEFANRECSLNCVGFEKKKESLCNIFLALAFLLLGSG